MLARWGRAASNLSATIASSRQYALGAPTKSQQLLSLFHRNYTPFAKAAAAAAATSAATVAAPYSPAASSPSKRALSKPEVKLNTMFWSKPSSLALPPNSPSRIEEPQFEGIKRILLKLILFYSKQSKSIRGANVVYKRIISQVDKSAIYDVFHLEKTFKTTFSLLVLHMWLILRRLKEDGNEGREFGQYLYEIYNHDVELRVSEAGVNLLLTKWMKDLEKIFYGNIVAYDNAMKPEAKHDELSIVIWRNIFSDDGSDIGMANDSTATAAVQAMARYTRRECTCLSLTEKDAIFSGNFIFTSLGSHVPNAESSKTKPTYTEKGEKLQ